MSTTNEYISRALANLNITQLNPMQEATLSASYHQRDIVLLSATGSGKTLSFLLPLLHLLTLDSSRPQALILAPSRELALQIEDVFKAMKSPWKCCCCYGGHPIALERRSIEGNNPEVIIGTPGRITDHLRKGYIDPRGIRTLVIDEFDKSLEFGFHDDMAQIIDELRGLTKKILLSATDSEQIPEFTGVSQIERLDFLPHTDEQESRLTLRRVISSTRDKSTTLGDLLCLFGDSSTIVFCNHRDAVDRITDRLLIEGFSVIGFHGAMEQPERERALFRFKTRGCNILISTDLAARGLDISQVEQVIHYQLPSTEDSYIHRNGRTARWDARG
ncbi:MAG: DEAD/DEAH box helicase, partial [Rikenellaceae bacterium]